MRIKVNGLHRKNLQENQLVATSREWVGLRRKLRRTGFEISAEQKQGAFWI